MAQGLAKRVLECTDELRPRCARGRRTCDHDIGTGGEGHSMATEIVAEDALDPIADHCAGIHLSRHRETDACSAVVWKVVQGEHRRRSTMALCEHGIELSTRAYPRAARVTGGGFDGGKPGYHERSPFMPDGSSWPTRHA
jgi:hypothetical protein